ncbi:hypothetical protein NOL37_24195 [Vibrio parahaemolyticus]|uniref:hypothetical protein n=1 Tax=Vibrio parahaemolyticus TaxID=670 RepID=UPI00226A8582|nr:hypothetical protein [Vibrio parahaemolyticus]MCX8861860.1 hypothetical protein [Vibrio parahaemolyticus]MCX8870202.1 hypothetical protein [Vibrio parahaemolyticus]
MERFLFGSLGAIVPDIILLYSKRFSAPSLEFTTYQFIVVTVIYMTAAGIVAMIYPYKTRPPEKWNFFTVGVVFPVIISSLIAVTDRTLSSEHVGLSLRGGTSHAAESMERVSGTLVDVLSIY